VWGTGIRVLGLECGGWTAQDARERGKERADLGSAVALPLDEIVRLPVHHLLSELEIKDAELGIGIRDEGSGSGIRD